jgi:hypothetical protein
MRLSSVLGSPDYMEFQQNTISLFHDESCCPFVFLALLGGSFLFLSFCRYGWPFVVCEVGYCFFVGAAILA